MNATFVPKWATIALGAERFGDQLYNENKIGIAIAKNTGRVSLGLKASFLGQTVQNISAQSTILTEFGVMAKVSKTVTIGFHAQNLTCA